MSLTDPELVALSSISQALAAGDATAVQKSLFGIEEMQFFAGKASGEFWRGVIDLVRSPGVTSFEGGWHVLHAFELNWDELDEEIRAEIVVVMRETYPLFGYWMGFFYVSELIGTRYCDASGLQFVTDVAGQCSDLGRSFLAHTLEHIAKDSTDEDASRQALRLLGEMQGDASEVVREAANESMENVKRIAK